MEIGTPITLAFLTLVWIYFVTRFNYPKNFLGLVLKRFAILVTFVFFYFVAGSLVAYDNSPITNGFLWIIITISYIYAIFMVIELIYSAVKKLVT